MRLDFLFPRECAWCGKEGDYLCQQCKQTLTAHPEICPFCHKQSKNFRVCKNCKELYPTLEGIVIGFAYKDLLKKLIYKVKFFHKKDGIEFLMKRLSLVFRINESLREKREKNQIFLSFVPSHWRRKYFEKGYNQSEMLAKALAKELQIPFLQVAKKTKYTLSQLHFDKKGRETNLRNVFECLDLTQIPLHSSIVIVDDVTTTGSTILELSKVIKESRSDLHVRGLVIARHM